MQIFAGPVRQKPPPSLHRRLGIGLVLGPLLVGGVGCIHGGLPPNVPSLPSPPLDEPKVIKFVATLAKASLEPACHKMDLHRCGRLMATLVAYLEDKDKGRAHEQLALFVDANTSEDGRAKTLELVDEAQTIRDVIDAVPGASAILADPKVSDALASFEELVDDLERLASVRAGGKAANQRPPSVHVECGPGSKASCAPIPTHAASGTPPARRGIDRE